MTRVKTPRIGMFFISLESYWNVDVENELTWTIWTFAAQVMAKRKAENQIGNLIFDNKKSRIDPTLMRAGGMRHVVRKLYKFV